MIISSRAIEFVNRTYLQFFTVALPDVVGQKWKNFVHFADREIYSQQLLAASTAGRSFRAEVRFRRGNGEWRWVDSWAVPRSTKRDRASGMVGCSTDITERKRAEERIRELGAIVECSDDAILGKSLDGIITSWNKGAEKIYGYSENEVIGRPTSILVSADRPEEAQEILSRLARGQVVDHYATVRGKKSGEEIHVSLTVSPIRNQEGKIVGVADDITQTKETENSLQHANAQLHVLSRRLFQVQEDERRSLARELHDRIGQELTAVKIDLQTTQRLMEPVAMARRLEEAIAVLERLVQQARELSLELRPALLDDLGLVPALRWYLDQQAQPAGFRATFFAEQVVERVEAAVETTCFRVAQEALTNIIRHAHAHTVSLELHPTKGSLHLVVRDDGIGFDVATAQQGVSSGLLGMRERVGLLGGELDCKSAPGRGTEIHSFLPLQESNPEEPRP